MNRYLEKIAQTAEKKKSIAKDVASAGVGAHLLSKVPQRLLGYHKVYHGTTNENASIIRKNGFDPSKGGTGASKLSGYHQIASKNKIHFTKTKPAARIYSGGIADKLNKEPSKLHAVRKALRDSYTGKGSVVKARVPHSMWGKMQVDKDSSGPDTGIKFVRERMKERASTYHRKVGKKFVMGEGGGGMGQFATKNNLKRYLSTKSGRARALGGVGQLVAGSALITNAVNNHRKDHK